MLAEKARRWLAGHGASPVRISAYFFPMNTFFSTIPPRVET